MQFSGASQVYINLQLWLKKNQQILYISLLLMCFIGIAFSITAQFLKLDALVVTPADELARAVAHAENWYEALRSGQYVPIIQNPPLADQPDVPSYQYYAFMNGVAALPGFLFSMPTLSAVTLGFFLFRIAGAAGVYWAAKLLGGNRKVSLLASLVYYMTPYVITTLYGRVATGETLAHCELPFLVVGLLLGLRGSLAAGAVTIAVTVLLLSLTHAIFLLWGCIAVVVMMSVSMSKRVFITGIVGLAAGVLLSTFRWYPMYVTKDLLERFDTFGYSPNSYNQLTSWQGLIGFPKSLGSLLKGQADTYQLFLTPGWFTLPVIFGLIVILAFAFLKKNRNRTIENPIIYMVLIPNIIFMLLAFSIGDIYSFLPHITWNVQFPYRLLVFVALLTALSLPILLPKLNSLGFVVLAIFAVTQSAALIFNPPYTELLKASPKTIATAYANYDFLIPSRYALFGSNELMHDYAARHYPQLPSPRHATSLSSPIDSSFIIPRLNSIATHQYNQLQGIAKSNSTMIDIWMEDSKNPLVKSPIQHIAPGSFSLVFPLPETNRDYRLVTQPKLVTTNTEDGTIIQLSLAEAFPTHVIKNTNDKQVASELRLSGKSIFTNQSIDIWIAKAAAPQVPITGKVSVPPGEFNLSLPYPNDSDEYILVPSKFLTPADESPLSSDQQRYSLQLHSVEIVARDTPQQPRITYGFVDTIKSEGYSRLYSVRKEAWWTPDGLTKQAGTVELPIAFNPLYIFSQNGHLLNANTDEKARANISTNDLTHDILVRYRLPLICYIAPTLGLILLIVFALFLRREKSAARAGQ